MPPTTPTPAPNGQGKSLTKLNPNSKVVLSPRLFLELYKIFYNFFSPLNSLTYSHTFIGQRLEFTEIQVHCSREYWGETGRGRQNGLPLLLRPGHGQYGRSDPWFQGQHENIAGLGQLSRDSRQASASNG